MSKEELQAKLDNAKPWMIMAGIAEKDIFLTESRGYKIASKWWSQFQSCIDEVKSIYNRVKPETWESYKALGIKNLKEQKLLAAAKKAVLNFWNEKRPKCYGPTED